MSQAEFPIGNAWALDCNHYISGDYYGEKGPDIEVGDEIECPACIEEQRVINDIFDEVHKVISNHRGFTVAQGIRDDVSAIQKKFTK